MEQVPAVAVSIYKTALIQVICVGIGIVVFFMIPKIYAKGEKKAC